ncbi:hypothetical protein KHU50_010693 [Colletotrichum sp. SAR 10_65]|nr:hypothetical protein KHU50_010693 [Colletotrichum sp. SAR 10_65]KAJ5003646.1 hypothetical protein K4K48_011403 [Colletotrichum sp. SAR 10_66]
MDTIAAGHRALSGNTVKRYSIPRKPIAKTVVPTAEELAVFAQSTHGLTINTHSRPPTREYGTGDEEQFTVLRQESPKESPASPPRQNSEKLSETKYDEPRTRAISVSDGNEAEKGKLHRSVTWRPKWLRPQSVGTFAVFFLLMTAGLVFMMRYSNQHDGLVKTQANLVYVWRIGPVAAIALLAVLWARVELQAMRYMPWIAMRQNMPLGKDGYALDYTAMSSFVALIQSLQHKHYLVFLTTTIGFILKAQIIMAPALYGLATVEIPSNITTDVLDSFNVGYLDDTDDTTPYYAARAMKDFDMLYPFGVSKTAAYQTFREVNGTARGTSESPMTAVVDGFFSDMQCLKMQSHSTWNTTYSEGKDGDIVTTVGVNLTFEGCDAEIPVINYEVPQPSIHSGRSWEAWGTVNGTLSPRRPCRNLPDQSPQFVFWMGRFDRSATNSSRMYLTDGAAVLCSPTAWLSKVEVVDDGIIPKITVLEDQPKTIVAADTWKLLYKSIPENMGGHFVPDTYKTNTAGPLKANQLFWGNDYDSGDASLITTDNLYDSVKNLTQTLGPFLGHYLLREPDNFKHNGAFLESTDKLIVNQLVCVVMIVLSALSTCIAFLVAIRFRRRTAVWHRDPATMVGNLIFFRDHPKFVEGVESSALIDISAVWRRCRFTPTALRLWIRAPFVIFVAILAAGLIYTLRLSETSNGFIDVNEDGYWHLLWTSLPATVALVVSGYVSSCDHIYRNLALLSCLSSRPCSVEEVDCSLLDMLGIRALYHSFRRRIWALTLAQTLAIICGLLTTLLAVLFTVETVPEQTNLQLTQQTWFGTQPGAADNNSAQYSVTRMALAGLLSRAEGPNFSSSRNTFGDLVFPILGGLDGIEDAQNKTLKMTVPAAQTQSNCKKLPDDQYSFILKNNMTESGLDYYQTTVTEPFTCSNSKQTSANMTNVFNLMSDAGIVGDYFAGIMRSHENLRETIGVCNLRAEGGFTDEQYFPVRTHTYYWGKYSAMIKGFEFLEIWKCNYTVAKVDTEVNLINVDGEFIIDADNPPITDPSTMRTWDPPIDLPLEAGLSRVELNDTLADVMKNEIQSYVKPWAGDLEVGELLRRLNHKYSFIQGQLLNVEGRLGLDEDSTSSGAPGALPDIDAVVIDTGRRRLKQSPMITYIIVAILCLAGVVNFAAILFKSRESVFNMGTRGLAPEGFSSIESMVGLLRGSNAADHLPSGTHMLLKEELHGHMSNVNFQMGWFQKRDGTRVFTVGVLGDDGFELKGTKKATENEIERLRRLTYDTFGNDYMGNGHGA